MNKKLQQIIACTILYLTASLLTIFAIWSYTHSMDIVSQAKESGQIIDNYSIISFYMGNSAQYFVYALILAAIGLILQKKQILPSNTVVPANHSTSNNDNELDEWFEEIESAE
jgi:nucleoside permease NupC